MNVLELHNICKTYPGSDKKANDNITLNLQKGEILCLAGENGAGKTTLMKILYGHEKQDSGDIYINGKKEQINSVLDAKKLGIGMVHQHFMLFPEYTVAQNIVMGIEPRKYGVFFDNKKAANIADKIITENNFSIKSSLKIKELTLGEMQQTEICRILNQNAQIIILDEPTSILTAQETKSLLKKIKYLADNGKSIILITHKINEIKQISGRVAIMRGGELTGIHNINEIDENKIANLVIGESISVSTNKKTVQKSSWRTEGSSSRLKNKNNNSVIEFDNVTVKRPRQKCPLLENISFSVYPGEILGFAGVGGNGLGVIEAVLGGFLHPCSGKVLYKGKDISKFNTRALRKQGLAYVPSDRIKVGSAQDATIKENMIINNALLSKNLLEYYKIDAPSIDNNASALSGGNLQKLILAREINNYKDYIVFSEPSWGLDIISSSFIIEEIDSLRKKGAAVILISTNLDEIISLADRVVVMCRGKIAGVFSDVDESIKEKVGNYMQGLGADNSWLRTEQAER